MQTVPCEYCGQLVQSFPCRPRRFCSRSCAMSVRNKTPLNPAFHRDLSGDRNPMYGKGRSGADNPMYGKRGSAAPRWKGGRKVRKDGYSFVVVPDDHPHPSFTKSSGTKYVLEHRYVMEQHIGRYLSPLEVVHHRDGNPSNNTIDNLQLFPSQQEHIKIAHSALHEPTAQ